MKKKIVGFFGIIFSDTHFDQNFQFANVTTWVVKKEYRGHSIKLLKKSWKMINLYLYPTRLSKKY